MSPNSLAVKHLTRIPEIEATMANPLLSYIRNEVSTPMISPMRVTKLRVFFAIGLLVGSTVLATRSVHAAKGGGTAGRPRRGSKLDLELTRRHQRHDDDLLHVIITPVKGRHAAAAQTRRAHGDAIRAEHAIVDAFSATIHAKDLDALEADPDVASVSADAVVQSDAIVGETGQTSPSTLLETLGLDAVRDTGPTGKGIGIAVIDSGLERGSDLNGGEHDQQYDVTGGPRRVSPYDDYGHGTHVSGLIGGSGAGSQGDAEEIARDGNPHRIKVRVYRGIAPNARIISLKVLDSHGAGLTSDVIEAVEFAVQNRDRLKIDIINLSLGHPVFEPRTTDPLVQAVEAASRAGIVVVAAAGNFGRNPTTGVAGYGGITSPGNAESAITVGAVDTQDTVSRLDDTVASYSSRGPTWYDAGAKPDVVAPGSRLVAAAALRSSLYGEYPDRRVGWARKQPQYLRLSGTSMAAAVTTGVVALMLEAHEEHFKQPLTPNAVKALLEFSAIPLAGVDRLTQGSGNINADGAIRLAASVDPSVPAGAWWLTIGVDPSTTIGGDALPWGQAVIWGTTIMWGTTAYYNLGAWSSTIMWGTTVTWGSTIMWGTTDLVWDDPQSWASAIVWGDDALDVGSAADGTIDWSKVGPTTIMWGTVTP
jgi:serine protease AprX